MEKLSLEELRNKRSHEGEELNNWDPAQHPIAHELWQKQQEQGYTGKCYSIYYLHWLTGGQLFPPKINTTEPTTPLHFFSHFNVFIYFLPAAHITHITEPLLYVYYIHKWCSWFCYNQLKYIKYKYILPFLAAGSSADENRLTTST